MSTPSRLSSLESSDLLPRRYQVQYDEGFDNILIVDGVPVIDKSKLDKLLQKISKDFSRKGCPIKPDNIIVPWNDSNGKSKGCVVLLRPDGESGVCVHAMWLCLQLHFHGVQERR